jgi:hypothetical protein
MLAGVTTDVRRRTHVVKKLFVLLALAAALFVVAQADDADAAWRCGPGACWWTPGYTGYVPPYAYRWGPPHRPHCYWRVGRRGVWRYDC